MPRPTQYQKLSLQLDADNKKLKAKLANTKKQMKGVGSSVKSLGGMIAGAFAVGAIVNFGKEAMKLAGQAEGVKAAFIKLNNPQLLANLRKATRGTVSDLELMKSAVKADNFKVPIEKLASFFEFATKRSAQTGESVDFLVESIVNGIGRKSTLVMDNLGISAAELQAEIKKTGDFGAAAGNIIERELAKAGDVATTSAQKMASWGATMDNLKVTVGTELNKALNALAPLIDNIIRGAIKGFKWMADGIRTVANEFITLYNESFEFRGVIETIVLAGKIMVGWFVTNLKALWQILKSTKDIFIAAFTPGKSVGEAIKKGWSDIKTLYSDMGTDVAEAFHTAVDNVTGKEKLSLLPTGGEKEELFTKVAKIGKEVVKVFKASIKDPDTIFSGIFGEPDEEVADVWEPISKQVERLRDVASIASTAIQELGASLVNTMFAGKSAAMSFGDTMKQWATNLLRQLAAVLIKAIAVAAVLSALGLSTLSFGSIIKNTLSGVKSIGEMMDVKSFSRGTNFVPKTGLAMVHKGEKILRKDQDGGGNVIAGDWVIRGDDLHFIQKRFNQTRENSLG